MRRIQYRCDIHKEECDASDITVLKMYGTDPFTEDGSGNKPIREMDICTDCLEKMREAMGINDAEWTQIFTQ